MNPRVVTIPLDNTEVTEAHGVKQRFGDERYVIHNTVQPDLRGLLASQFAERWAMVAGVPDGEDSAGRQKLRPMTPGELAQHACDCVTALFLQFSDRKWLLHVPSYDEVIASLAEQEEQPSPPVVNSPGQSQQQRQEPLPPGGPTPDTKG
jgi:hypothetical protein